MSRTLEEFIILGDFKLLWITSIMWDKVLALCLNKNEILNSRILQGLGKRPIPYLTFWRCENIQKVFKMIYIKFPKGFQKTICI